MSILAEIPRPVFAGAAFVLGLIVGSFLNVVIHRLPRGESLVHPGSHCPACNAKIAPWDNVPVLAYLWLGGRCRLCRAPISPRYPLIELLTGLVFAAIALRYGALDDAGLARLRGSQDRAAAIDSRPPHHPRRDLAGWAAGRAGRGAGRTVGRRYPGGALSSPPPAPARRRRVDRGPRSPHRDRPRPPLEHWPGEGEVPPRPASVDY
jgi:hypothetical protein